MSFEQNTTGELQRKSGFFSIIKDALKNENQDFTKGSIRRGVVLLAIPMILEMMMESVFAVVDIYFVGHIEGHASQAVTTVVLTESVLMILYSAAMALSMGATAVVARRVGEKKPGGRFTQCSAGHQPGADGNAGDQLARYFLCQRCIAPHGRISGSD